MREKRVSRPAGITHEAAPAVSEGTKTDTSVTDATDYVAQLRRRRDASRHLAVLDCDCGDPWHAGRLEPSPRNRQASRRAWHHLQDHGLRSELTDAALGGEVAC